MFSSDNYNNNRVYPLSLLLSPLSSHDNNIPTAAASLHNHHHHYNLHPNDPLLAHHHHHHHQFSSSAINPNQMATTTSPQSLKNYMAFSSNNILMNVVDEQNFVNGCSELEVVRGKKPMKKDRHSKIYTAQGLRDRRVRLSIGIAREFFDLQDMLGFDKASKTLEWLLKKSRKAIKELEHTKKHDNGLYSDIHNGDEYYENNGNEEADENDDDDEDEDEDKSFLSGSSSEYFEDVGFDTKKLVMGASLHREKRIKNELSNISKGSSTRGREKAKERAREKVGSATIDQPETILEITQSQILNPLSSISSNETEEKLSTSVHGQNMTPSFYKQAIEDTNRLLGQELANQEPIFMNTTIKSLPSIPSHNQQHGADLPKDLSSSGNHITFLSQNWDIYDHNPLGDPRFFAVTNMNMSTGL